jgi:hypothetical protein
MTCPNAKASIKPDRSLWYVSRWADKYLRKARKRIGKDIKGFDLTIEDVYAMQHMCAYEVDFSPKIDLTLLLIYVLLRPLLSATANSASCLPRKSGKDSTMR